MSPGGRPAFVALCARAYSTSAAVILMRLPRSCDCTTTSAVITLVMLAIGRGLYCRRPHSCLPVVPFASSAACAAMRRGGWRRAVAALADPSTHVPVTATNAMVAATVRAPRNPRDRDMALLRKVWNADRG